MTELLTTSQVTMLTPATTSTKKDSSGDDDDENNNKNASCVVSDIGYLKKLDRCLLLMFNDEPDHRDDTIVSKLLDSLHVQIGRFLTCFHFHIMIYYLGCRSIHNLRVFFFVLVEITYELPIKNETRN